MRMEGKVMKFMHTPDIYLKAASGFVALIEVKVGTELFHAIRYEF